MHRNRNLLYGKGKYFIGLIALLFISVICVAFNMENGDEIDVLVEQVGGFNF